MDKKILDVTCGSRTIWFDKNHPAAIYADKRVEELYGVWKSGNGQSERSCIIAPDVQCDFTDLPFDDNSFALVVWDPPHLRQVGEDAWFAKWFHSRQVHQLRLRPDRERVSHEQLELLPQLRGENGRR